jgi:cobyrinic acid a,c-diamide synthase
MKKKPNSLTAYSLNDCANTALPKAIIVAGTSSGSGKTTVTLGIMAALARMGKKVQPFKCGPDFIDPSLHKLVTGTESRNLDMWMAGEPFTRQTFSRHVAHADIGVIEGVMGMFDGGDSSSAFLSEKLQVPVILVLDVRSQAESAAAVVKGFEMLNPNAHLKGVILNRVASPRHLQLVTDAIKEHCQAEILGHLPRNVVFKMPERHLGLHMGAEEPISQGAIDELAETIAEHVDLERLLAIAKVAESVEVPALELQKSSVRIAVAQDRAFCFYYEDNLDLLRDAGAELVFFSPLDDGHLPADIDGIYFGGGYPELHAGKLSQNRSMLTEVKAWGENDGVIYAECGGFMYLCRGIVDQNGAFFQMADLFPVTVRMQNKRASLGYREVTLKEDGLLGAAGTVLRGHEFHYSVIEDGKEDLTTVYNVTNNSQTPCGEEGYCLKNVLGGYMHLHFGFNPQVVRTFVEKCRMSNGG